MSGGIAYVYDDSGQLPRLANLEQVTLESPDKPEDVSTIRRLLENHLHLTGSSVAKAILDDWKNEIRWFVKVMPNDYRQVLEKEAEMEQRANLLSKRQSAPV